MHKLREADRRCKVSTKQAKKANRQRARREADKKRRETATGNGKVSAAKSNGVNTAAVGKGTKPRASSLAGAKVGDLLYIPTDLIEPNEDQPRHGKDYDRIRDEIAPSILRRGQSTPGKVCFYTQKKGKKYMLVGGEHRYWSCERIAYPFWAVIVSVKDAKDLFLQSVEDNEGVKGYTDNEKAAAIVRMRDDYKMSWEDIQDRMGGMVIQTIKNFYNLGTMPSEVKVMVADKLIPKGVVTELAAVGKPHIVATAQKIQGLPAEDARIEIRRVQQRHGRATGETIPRKRKISDDREIYENAVRATLRGVQRLNDRYKAEDTKAMLASSTSPDANLLLLNRLDQIITNVLGLQEMALENLPTKFRAKVLEGMQHTLKYKLRAVILSSGQLSQAEQNKLGEILAKLK